MKRFKRNLVVVASFLFASLGGMMSPALAAFHLWHVKEVFSNADGSVQFIEMFDSFNEPAVGGFKLRSNSDGVIKDFTFPASVVANTTDKHMLIATPGFGSLLGAVTPTFTFDQSSTPLTLPFFNPNATNITFTFTGSNDSMAITPTTPLPKDGIHSLTDNGAFGIPPGTPNIISDVNSPSNLTSNSVGGVNLSTGDYNGNNLVDAADFPLWRNNPPAFGNSAAGYNAWRIHFGNPAGGGSGIGLAVAAPEPISGTLLLMAALGTSFRRRRR